MKKKVLRILAVLLIFSICTSLLPASVLAVPAEEPAGEKTPTMVDFIAGTATAEDIYGVLDPSIVPAAIDYNEAVEKNHIARCYEDEGTDLNKIIFLNIDGTKTMYTFDFPVKYVDGNGNIQDIRLEIADSTVNAGEFETAANDTVTTFSAQFTDGIALEGNDTEIRLIPVLPSANSGMATMSTTEMAAPTAPAQRIDANTVAYPYDSKTTVEYSLTYTGFKEDIVVSEYTGQTTYPFRLLTNGLALEEIGGSFFLVDDEGNIEASIGDIIIFTADERNNAFGDIEPKTIVENQEYLLNIVVDAEYLADPATTYPIRIDPTVKINYNYGAGAVEDITISTNTNFSGSYDYLFVGRRQTEGIARILMRFPGLDVSQLAGATVTDAHVRIRDMMCEDVPLDVSCHIFTGNVWAESSATWANCSPNSYVTTPLSTNTLKWSIGNTFSNKHWYQFDVTEAVQGWIDGNYSQSKGFLFKVASAVENGSTIQNRTFGSYNRTNYRPSLTVTYTPNTSQTLTNDTYYLNNRGTGKYLQLNTTNNARGVSGLLSSLGNRIQWKIQPVGNGYVIRAASNPNLCLSCGASPGDSSVYALTVSDSSIPSTCMWSIIPASGGDYLIRSMAYGNYLFSSVTSIYTSSSTGSYGSAAYEKYVWRAAKTSEYGNASSYTYKELENGFSINDMVIGIGGTQTPAIATVSGNTLWANAKDFTFSLSSGTNGCISITGINNTFTGLTTGVAEYAATHKVTGRTCSFYVFVELPSLFNTLLNEGSIAPDKLSATDDGLFISTASLASILSSNGITYLPENGDASELWYVHSYYDDWYFLAVVDGTHVSYGLYKMREQEADYVDANGDGNTDADGDAPGVTISFIGLNTSVLITCFNNPSVANRYSLLQALKLVTGPDISEHDPIISNYFADTTSDGPYLIAEKYISFLMSTTSTNVLNAPNAMTDIFASIAEINEYLQMVGLDAASRVALIQQKADLERVPNALVAINEAAGRMIYNSSNNTINIQNRNALTLYEKQAILACFTADISFNMFAAEAEYHADVTASWVSDIDEVYKRAVRADMAIGEEYESGISDQYYDPNSALVQAQINAHGEC